MDRNGKLSEKEAALIAAAKRELAAGRDPRKASLPATPPIVTQQRAPAAPAVAVPPAQDSAPATAAAQPAVADAHAALAERMLRLMAEEAAQHRRRHKQLKLYLVIIPLAVIVLCLLWVLFKTLPRLR
jgi:type IV secretory pathway VirB10-like protein